MSEIKIIQFADYYNEVTGNPLRVYANELKKQKYDVHVFSSDKVPSPAGYDDRDAKVKIHRFKGVRFFSKCFFPGAIPALLFQVKPGDIVHTHVLGFFSTFVAGYLRFFKKFKLVVTPDYDAQGKEQNFFLRLINYFFFVIPAKKADVLLPFTQNEMDALREKFGFKNQRMELMPIGIHWKAFKKKANHAFKKELGFQDKFVLLSVCYLTRKKNLEMGIKALKAINQPGAILVHVGGQPDAAYKSELDRLVNELDLKNQVFFLGNKRLSELIDYYAVGDAFLNLGFNESYAIPVLEAMASGLPVLTTRVGIAPEVITEKRHGFFIENERMLAEKADWLMAHKTARQKMALENITQAKNFDWGKIISKLEKVYRSL